MEQVSVKINTLFYLFKLADWCSLYSGIISIGKNSIGPKKYQLYTI